MGRQFDILLEVGWWLLYLSPFTPEEWIKDAKCAERREKNFPPHLSPFLEKKRQPGKRIKVLDVGAGPLSPLAWGVEKDKFDLVALDPLVNYYRFLLKFYRIRYPVKPLPYAGENLLKVCEKGSFDIVFSRNALDHAVDPEKCIENIAQVLKINGILYLAGFTREGTKQKWRGMHKHDLFVEQGHFMWSTRNMPPKNLTAGRHFKCIFQDKPDYKTADWYVLILEKKN